MLNPIKNIKELKKGTINNKRWHKIIFTLFFKKYFPQLERLELFIYLFIWNPIQSKWICEASLMNVVYPSLKKRKKKLWSRNPFAKVNLNRKTNLQQNLKIFMVSSAELGTNQLNALIRATELWKSSKKTNQIHQENKKFRNKLFRQKKKSRFKAH